MTLFLLGALSAFLYLCASGLVADRLASREINGDMSGGEFLFVVMLWPVALPWMAARASARRMR